MSELDKKLVDIVDEHQYVTDYIPEEYKPEIVSQIKQAFIEAGYQHTPIQSLEEKLNESIMETIWIKRIDESEQKKVHPKWFVANGQMFTFGIDVDRIKQMVCKEAARRVAGIDT